MINKIVALMICMVICGIAFCTRYERTNPLDPKNQSSYRQLQAVVLSFVAIDSTGDATAHTSTAFSAYNDLDPNIDLLTFKLPINETTEINVLKSFLKEQWEPEITAPRELPRVFVGSKDDPVAGIASSNLHLDTLHSRSSNLNNQITHWTIEGSVSGSGRTSHIEVKLARLGDTRSDTVQVMLFLCEKKTDSWYDVKYVFPVQTVSPINAADINTIHFALSSIPPDLPSVPVYYALIISQNGIFEQGASF